MFRWDLGGIENGDSLNLDGVPFRLIRENAIELNRNGGVNTFSWHLRNPINNNDSWTVSDTTIVRQMMENPESFRRQLTNLAGFFNSLVDENGKKVPVIFRPWPSIPADGSSGAPPTQRSSNTSSSGTRRAVCSTNKASTMWYGPTPPTASQAKTSTWPVIPGMTSWT